MPSGDKTEAATPRHREEARKRGHVPKSTELNAVLGLLAGVLVLKFAGGALFEQTVDIVGSSLRNMSRGDLTVAGVMDFGSDLGVRYLAMMAPMFVAIMVVGVAGNVAQAGLVLTGKPLSPDFSRISPFKGFERLFSKRSVVESVKSIAKMAIVGYFVYQVLQDKYLAIVSMTGGDVRASIGVVADVAMEILTKSGLSLLALAALDYGYQRWDYEKNIRMTKEEVKEELRQSEGDPKMKARVRQLQRKLAARRMMQDVPKSDVVVTNPTHYAVALEYKPETMRSPVVVAKGQGLIAQKIKEVARDHDIPLVENKPLAQTLFKTVEIGAEIPPALYHAVAEVLAFIYSLRRGRRLGGQGIAT